ncbi:uncharacterized protein G2W53_016177 [Senna tora]|uniref:Uncharacterized protein n=1 Tax=Senna tora TaxID=362788 RepID=A0A834WWM0_9FABA|nr:uncharacterized protein G2W53_016177 [Senna tora]
MVVLPLIMTMITTTGKCKCESDHSTVPLVGVGDAPHHEYCSNMLEMREGDYFGSGSSRNKTTSCGEATRVMDHVSSDAPGGLGPEVLIPLIIVTIFLVFACQLVPKAKPEYHGNHKHPQATEHNIEKTGKLDKINLHSHSVLVRGIVALWLLVSLLLLLISLFFAFQPLPPALPLAFVLLPFHQLASHVPCVTGSNATPVAQPSHLCSSPLPSLQCPCKPHPAIAGSFHMTVWPQIPMKQSAFLRPRVLLCSLLAPPPSLLTEESSDSEEEFDDVEDSYPSLEATSEPFPPEPRKKSKPAARLLDLRWPCFLGEGKAEDCSEPISEPDLPEPEHWDWRSEAFLANESPSSSISFSILFTLLSIPEVKDRLDIFLKAIVMKIDNQI